MPPANRTRVRAIDAAQTVCVVVGITLGVVPLVRWVTGNDHGTAFTWLFGQVTDPYTYLLPLLVIAILVGAIAVLEWIKKQ